MAHYPKIAVSGGGSSFIYTQTLWVDPAGNDLTAAVGDFTKPWASVSTAIQYAMDNVNGGTVHIMSGKYIETVPIIATQWRTRGTNVISEPGVAIELDLGGNYWISDRFDPLIGFMPIRINWEGGFAYTPDSPGTSLPYTIKVLGANDYLYKSIASSYLRFKNVCIIKEIGEEDEASAKSFFQLRGGHVDYAIDTNTYLYLDSCRIYTTGIFEPIITTEDDPDSSEYYNYYIDIKSSELIWAGRYDPETANTYNCIRFGFSRNGTSWLNLRNSLIWGKHYQSESPIYTSNYGGNKISIDDVQFQCWGLGETIRPTICSDPTPNPVTPIYIGARCISAFDVNFQCSNPLLGDLSTGLDFPTPIL